MALFKKLFKRSSKNNSQENTEKESCKETCEFKKEINIDEQNANLIEERFSTTETFTISSENELETIGDSIEEKITEEKKETKQTKRNIYYVSARKDKDGKKVGWEVKKEKAAKITKLCSTKEEAIALVKELAGNQGSTCIIRKMDGSIQETLRFEDPKKVNKQEK